MGWRLHPESVDAEATGLTKRHHRRGAVLMYGLLAGFLGVAGRLVYLQIIEHDVYVAIAEKQQIMSRPIPARRGAFFDRAGRPLCVSMPVTSVFVVPRKIKLENVPKVSVILSKLLGVDEETLRNGILRNYDKAFFWVKRRVTDREAAAVARLKLKCVGLRTEFRRAFPEGVLAAHLIGWVDVDQKGQEGLERVYDACLTGTNGWERLDCDNRRRPRLTDRADFKPAVHGNDVHLTIDAEIQRMVSVELDAAMTQWHPVSVTIIVMEVKTGKILALGNRPTFSPMYPAASRPADRLNRAVGACYEPGSVFKPFVMAGYLDAQLGRIDDRVFCENGLFRIRGRLLRDHHPYGWLTLTEVIEKSSNVGIAKVGLDMGPGRLYGIINVFGFGSSTGSGLPGEVDGIITPFRKWNHYTVTSVPMGQEIAVTPLQLITAFNAIANDGVLVKPQTVERITGPDGKEIRRLGGPEVVRRVVSSETARLLVDPMMTRVVQQGTGTHAKVGVYPKFGKTGTAQKLGAEGGYSHSRFVSSFVCGAPSADPRISVLVILDEPRHGNSYYGGTVAAPAAGRLTEKVLKLLDTPEETVAGGPGL
ncbi:MAG TPA: penicillin-binding protein 2 [Planctomycetota bacterium]|nr:penicillin-binding protein 2 [Planctomycetota bacterium]